MYPSYQRFLELRERGLKKEANQLTELTVAEFKAAPKHDFIIMICEIEESGKINHILWRGIVFPWLENRLDSDTTAIRCLIRTIQNLYSDKSAHKSLNFITEEQLLRKLLVFVPDDVWAKEKLLNNLSNWLKYTIHEWPSGVLYGLNGATIEECAEILEAVKELRRLDTLQTYVELADDVDRKTLEYRDRLENDG